MLKIGRTLAKDSGLEKLLDCLRYIFASKKERINDKNIEITNLLMETLMSVSQKDC